MEIHLLPPGVVDLRHRIDVEEVYGTLFQPLAFRDAVEIRGWNHRGNL